jgi:hypothetical protein
VNAGTALTIRVDIGDVKFDGENANYAEWNQTTHIEQISRGIPSTMFC